MNEQMKWSMPYKFSIERTKGHCKACTHPGGSMVEVLQQAPVGVEATCMHRKAMEQIPT